MNIAFITPSGYGNLGDVAIQDAFLDNVRRQFGSDVEFVGITQNPSDTEARHHVRAVPMDVEAFRLRASPSPNRVAGSDDDQARPTLLQATMARGVKRALKEILHWGIAFREMRRADILVVSGGGQLDDHWGGPWRVPYALWKWSLAARLFRAHVVFLSVGAGTTESRVTQFLLRSALRRAQYVSFRDSRTAARVRSQRLSASTRVVPDLAFSHLARSGRNGQLHRAPRIVISPMAFLDPATWPAKDASAYRSAVERTGALARRLVQRGYHVTLCTSDTPDIKTAEEVFETASQHDAAEQRSGVLELADTRSLASLLECLRSADLVIASRLHGLILANLVGAPTIALSYDWKVDEHMRDMGLARYIFGLETFEPRDVVRASDEALAQGGNLSAAIVKRCGRLSTKVVEQYGVALRPIAEHRTSSGSSR